MHSLFCCDLDGTLIWNKEPLSPQAIATLEKMIFQGWQIAFITGASTDAAKAMLGALPIPYILASFNGGEIFLKEKRLYHHFTPIQQEKLHETTEQIPIEFLWLGKHYNDLKLTLLYPATSKNKERLSYMYHRAEVCGEHLIETSWEEITTSYHLYSCKAFMTPKEAFFYKKFFAESYNTALAKDPVSKDFMVLQITPPEVDKGKAVDAILKAFEWQRDEVFLVCAGDDYNDIAMLKKADIALSYKHSPLEVQQANLHTTLVFDQKEFFSVLEKITNKP